MHAYTVRSYITVIYILQYEPPAYRPLYSSSRAPNVTYSNPYIENPKGDYKWGTMYDHAESVLERKWRTYFGAKPVSSSSALPTGKFLQSGLVMLYFGKPRFIQSMQYGFE